VGGNLINLRRVYSSDSDGFSSKLDAISVVRECLFPFLYLWASVHLGFTVVHADDQCRLMTNVDLSVVGECYHYALQKD